MIAERLRSLSSVPLFRGLSDEQLLPLAEVAVPATYRPGEAIMRQGDPGESVYVITEGKVEVLARSEQDPGAREAVVAWLVSGDAVGELALLDERSEERRVGKECSSRVAAKSEKKRE